MNTITISSITNLACRNTEKYGNFIYQKAKGFEIRLKLLSDLLCVVISLSFGNLFHKLGSVTLKA